MKSIITGPGFYTSKAGKCEAEAESNDGVFMFGRCGQSPMIWRRHDGVAIAGGWIGVLRSYDITSVWTDKPKPIEAYVVSVAGANYPYTSRTEAESSLSFWLQHNASARLVHLIEAEDKP